MWHAKRQFSNWSVSLGIVVVEGIQVASDLSNVVLSPSKPRYFLPAAHLSLKAYPVHGELIAPPMNLGAVAGDAMR